MSEARTIGGQAGVHAMSDKDRGQTDSFLCTSEDLRADSQGDRSLESFQLLSCPGCKQLPVLRKPEGDESPNCRLLKK